VGLAWSSFARFTVSAPSPVATSEVRGPASRVTVCRASSHGAFTERARQGDRKKEGRCEF